MLNGIRVMNPGVIQDWKGTYIRHDDSHQGATKQHNQPMDGNPCGLYKHVCLNQQAGDGIILEVHLVHAPQA